MSDNKCFDELTYEEMAIVFSIQLAISLRDHLRWIYDNKKTH